MKKAILTYGLFGFATAFILLFPALYFGQKLSFPTQEVLGYVIMIASLIFVYFGIKHYRDHKNNGEIDFKKAFIIGVLISLFAAIGFGLIDTIYITNINPDVTEQYVAYEFEQLDARTDLSAEELKLKKLTLLKQSEAYGNPFIVFFSMTMIVLVIGVIISLISSLILQTKSNDIEL